MEEDESEDASDVGGFTVVVDPACPVTGHSGDVIQVDFSGDGARVISASSDNTVRFWDVGRQVRVFDGDIFAFVEGRSNEHKRGRYILTGSERTLRIYELTEEDGAAAAPVACFQAPEFIVSLRCRGAAICVGGDGGAVCILSALFLTA